MSGKSNDVIERLEELRERYARHQQEAIEEGDPDGGKYFAGKQAAIISAIEVVEGHSLQPGTDQ